MGSIGALPPLQIDRLLPKLKAGLIFDATVTVKVTEVAHCPAAGVKVYVPPIVLLTAAGLQVPVMPFCEVAGN